ncbi:hypothetical protein SMICM17S_06982 [Streptomyces microflavus]
MPAGGRKWPSPRNRTHDPPALPFPPPSTENHHETPHPARPCSFPSLCSSPPAVAALRPRGRDGSTDGKGGQLTLDVGDQKGGVRSHPGGVRRARRPGSTASNGPPSPPARRCWRPSTPGPSTSAVGLGNTPPVFAARVGLNVRRRRGRADGSSAGEAVVVPKDSPLKKPEQLKGRSIAVAQGSSAHFQLVASLRKAGLSLKDVKLNYLQPADALPRSAGARWTPGRSGTRTPRRSCGRGTPGC